MNFYDFVLAFDFTFEGNVHIFIYINYTRDSLTRTNQKMMGRDALEKQST